MPAPEDPNPQRAKIPDLEDDATIVVNEEARAREAPTLATSPPAPRGHLEPGLMLADGRYRIERFLGEGGMGSVYEAVDLELDIRLALKTLRAEKTASSALERFKREIHVARQVTHPNVCRLYDLGRHRSAEGGDLVFLTMQYLEGETLRERVGRAGRLPLEEIWPLARDMASALEAAHQAGIVHRDFKSGNVMLVPTREGMRAVVTDFGLAREMVDSGRETLTATAGFVGTPAYSSPEQIQGFEVGPATDIYAFGVVLYEMATGRLPFDDAPTAWIAVVRRLNELPTPPEALCSELPAGWNAAILRCLERDPDNRFAGAWEVIEALEPPASQADLPTPRPSAPVLPASGSGSRPASGGRFGAERQLRPATGSRPRAPSTAVPAAPGFDTTEQPPAPPVRRALPRELVLVGLGALLLLLALAFAFLQPNLLHSGAARPGAAQPAAGALAGEKARRTIALLGFQNLKGDAGAGWISTAITEMLAMEVAAGDVLRVIPSDQVARMKAEMRIGDGEAWSAARLAAVRGNLGTDLVVLGSFLVQNEGVLRLDLRVENAGDGEVVSRISEKGQESDLIALVELVGEQLRRDLGLSGLEPAEAQAVRAAFPESSAAARPYAEGLGHLHRFELVEATRQLEAAAREAPGNAMVLTALSDAYQLTGYERKAAESARLAFEASRGLATRYRLWIEGIHYEAAGDWPHAIETFESLWKLYPDDIEVGLRLAKTQVGRAGLYDDALASLSRLRKLPPPAGEDPRISLLEAFALLQQGQPDRALEVAQQAAEQSRQRGAAISEASANAYVGSARLARGENDLALVAIERARQLFLGAGYREGASQTLTSISQVLRARSDWAGAKARLEEAIALQREIGVSSKLRTSLGWLGGLHFARGELREAARLVEECLAMSEGNDNQLAFYRRFQGEVLVYLGENEKAAAPLAASRQQAELTGNRRLLNDLNLLEAQRALVGGRLDEAERQIAAVLEVYRQNGQTAELVKTGLMVARLALLRGDLARARTELEQTAERGQFDKYELASLEMRELETLLALDENDLDQAARLAGEQLTVPAAQQIARFEVDALVQLARVELLRAGAPGGEARREAAARYAEQAAERLETVEISWRRLGDAIQIERVRGLTGAAEERRKALLALRELRGDAEQRQYSAEAMEAELAAAEIAKLDDPAAGRAGLLRLAEKARAASFGSLARRAGLAAG